MLRMFADMPSGTELEPLQTHECKRPRPSVPLRPCIKLTFKDQKEEASWMHMAHGSPLAGIHRHVVTFGS